MECKTGSVNSSARVLVGNHLRISVWCIRHFDELPPCGLRVFNSLLKYESFLLSGMFFGDVIRFRPSHRLAIECGTSNGRKSQP